MNFHRSLLFGLIVLPSFALATVEPGSLFSDHTVLQRDMPVPVWGRDSAGQKITVSFAGQEKSAVADADGKWLLKLDPLPASDKGQVMTIAGSTTVQVADVLVGEVWLCAGQSNMAFGLGGALNIKDDVKTATDPTIRQLRINGGPADEPQTTVQTGGWVVGTPQTVTSFTAVGYFFARKLHDELHVPIGLINPSLGGIRIQSFMPQDALAKTAGGQLDIEKYQKSVASYTPESAKKAYDAMIANYDKQVKTYEALPADQQTPERKPNKPAEPPEPKLNPQHPYGLYCGRIAPLMPYAIRGAIWYQGEANAFLTGGEVYRDQLSGMIGAWRAGWGQGDFPFLIVQLPNFEWGALTVGWPLLRESQAVAAKKTPNAAVAVTIDVGEAKNLHPHDKRPVGQRLALAALNLAYKKDIVYSGPAFDSASFDAGKATLRFTSIGGGLECKGDKLLAFELAGEDKNFVAADASIAGDTVVVTSDTVKTPVAVRYAWAPSPPVTLYNKDGLPASPFRSDTWPLTAAPAGPKIVPVASPSAVVVPEVAAPPGPPAGKDWVVIPEFTDEFNGDKLDDTKWYDHDPKWIGRPPGLFRPSNVAVKDGMLQLTAREETVPAPDNPNPKLFNTFTTAFVKSKTLAHYGYYEIRAKPMNTNIVSAFWFYSIEPEWHTEIDVYEIPGGNEKEGLTDRMTIHIFKTPTFKGTDKDHIKSGERWVAPYRFADDFHIFGLEWNEKEIKWSVDGIVRRTAKNEYNSRPMNLCFDNETFPTWFGLPTKTSLPAVYQIDYVRAWKLAGDPAAATGNN